VQLISVCWPCPPKTSHSWTVLEDSTVEGSPLHHQKLHIPELYTSGEWCGDKDLTVDHEQRMIPSHEIEITVWRNHNSFLHFHEPHTPGFSPDQQGSNNACMDTDELELTQETKEEEERKHDMQTARTEMITSSNNSNHPTRQCTAVRKRHIQTCSSKPSPG
jgi:hypothetical protein